MRLILALGVALAAMATAAHADAEQNRVIIRHHGSGGAMDANHDGWLNRAEAAAAADAMFAELDANSDGRLTHEDHPRMDEDLNLDGELDNENCTRTEAGAGAGERRVIVICRGPAGGEATDAEADGERRIERRVTVTRGEHGEHGEHAAVPLAPMPPHPPLAMMFMHSEEADLNSDGAMSREEFRAQHLRFFDAGDVNGDGRVRLPAHHVEAPPPPAPPAPPAPPRRR